MITSIVLVLTKFMRDTLTSPRHDGWKDALRQFNHSPMSRRLQTIALTLLLSLALDATKLAATLKSVLPGFSGVVLCTGTAIEHIAIGPDGKPVDVVATDHPLA